jgi:hypothetical protein
MTLLLPAFWLDPALSRAMANAFDLQRKWHALEWDTMRHFQINRVDSPAVSPPDTAVLPGIFVDTPPTDAR